MYDKYGYPGTGGGGSGGNGNGTTQGGTQAGCGLVIIQFSIS